ncbi:hypothetical protein ACFWUP_06765 [Nocardia sp. NPDC058658]|uniref:hypothetical protein n=1 Tax=Nocardia sp. NPDC058658 TaxID=3346580 RepID=UPI003658C2A2
MNQIIGTHAIVATNTSHQRNVIEMKAERVADNVFAGTGGGGISAFNWHFR